MEIHPIFGVMGAKKKKGAESTRMGYSLTFSSTACFTYLMLTGFDESHGTGMLRS